MQLEINTGKPGRSVYTATFFLSKGVARARARGQLRFFFYYALLLFLSMKRKKRVFFFFFGEWCGGGGDMSANQHAYFALSLCIPYYLCWKVCRVPDTRATLKIFFFFFLRTRSSCGENNFFFLFEKIYWNNFKMYIFRGISHRSSDV